MAKEKVVKQAPPKGMDLNTAFNSFVQNNAIIAQQVQAMKLVAKGIDVEPIEKANQANNQIVIALANFINQKTKLPGKPASRAERRRADRAAKKQSKKRTKK